MQGDRATRVERRDRQEGRPCLPELTVAVVLDEECVVRLCPGDEDCAFTCGDPSTQRVLVARGDRGDASEGEGDEQQCIARPAVTMASPSLQALLADPGVQWTTERPET